MSSAVAQPGIVVGIDGAAHSHAALRWGAREAVLRNTALTLVYVAASRSRNCRHTGFWKRRFGSSRI